MSLSRYGAQIDIRNAALTEGFRNRFSISTSEKMKSLGMTGDKSPEDGMLKVFQATLKDSAILPLIDPSVLTFELTGERRVIVVERKDGSPLIQLGQPESGVFSSERVYFGRIAGRWEILA